MSNLVRPVKKEQLNSAFLWGESVFTRLLLFEGGYPFLADHLERLAHGIEYQWGVSFGSYSESVKTYLREFAHENKINQSVRLTFFRDGSKQLCWAFHNEALDGTQIEKNLRLKTVQHPAPTRERPSDLKMGNYGEVLRLKRIYNNEGYDDILLIDRDQLVLETSFANIFFRGKNDVIYSPYYEVGILAGITRKVLVSFLKEKGFQLNEDPLPLSLLGEMKNCWKTSSVMGPVMIESIDSITFDEDKSLSQYLTEGWTSLLREKRIFL